jgi:hypothetical protein
MATRCASFLSDLYNCAYLYALRAKKEVVELVVILYSWDHYSRARAVAANLETETGSIALSITAEILLDSLRRHRGCKTPLKAYNNITLFIFISNCEPVLTAERVAFCVHEGTADAQ